MAEEQTEQKASQSPPGDDRNVPASVAVCMENLEALLRAVSGRPKLEPAVAPTVEVSLPDVTGWQALPAETLPPAKSQPITLLPITLLPITSLPVTSPPATVPPMGWQATEEPAWGGAAEKGPAPEAQAVEPSSPPHPSAGSSPETPTAEPQPHLVSKLALLASIRQRRATTARPQPELPTSASKPATSEDVPPAEWVIGSTHATTKEEASMQAEQSIRLPEELNARAREIPPSVAKEPHAEVPPGAAAAESTAAYSTPVGGTLFAAADRPHKDTASGTLKSLITSGPILGTLATVVLTIGFTAFLLMGHGTKSAVRAPKQPPKESVQDSSMGLPPAAASAGEKSSDVTPPVGADTSRKDDQAGARPELGLSVQTAPAQPAQIPPAPSSPAASAQPEEAKRAVARTFAPPLVPGANPESRPLIDAPAAPSPAVSVVPSAPIVPGIGALPPRVVALPPPPVAASATTPAAPPRQINVAGSVQATKLLKSVTPLYPALARTAHVQGTVRIRAVIGMDGEVKSLVTLSGPPLLVQPAADAVKKWRYQPTLRNGEPVEVVTDIELVFTM